MSRSRLIPRIASIAVISVVAGLTTTQAAFADDTTPPALTDVSIVGAPYTANVTNGPSSVGVRLHATDDVAVSFAQVTVSCVTGCDTSSTSSVQGSGGNFSGPPGNVSGSVTVQIPQTAQIGTWKVTDVKVFDTSSNQQDYNDAALATYDATRAFTVAKTADSTPPTLQSASVPGPTLDTTTSDKDVSLTLHITDTVPGFDHGDITMTDGGFNTKDFFVDASNLQSGTINDGTYLTEPQTFSFGDAGHWTVSAVDLFDRYGNEDTSTANTSAATFNVNATNDTAGPTVPSTPSWTNGSVDATTGDATTNLSIHIDDNVSGFSFGDFSLDDGLGDTFGASIDPSMLSSGNLYNVPVTVPARTPSGSYAITNFELFDRYGNQSAPNTSSWPHLSVSTTGDAANGPTMSGFVAGPTALNIADNPFRQLTINVDITDDVSGFDHADLHLLDPNSQPVDVPAGIVGSNRVSGTSLNGHYVAQVIPQFLSINNIGNWQITSVDLFDLAGNQHTINTGLPSFTVSSTPSADASAPQLTSISMTPASVNTTSGDQTVHVTAVVTDPGTSGGPASGVNFGFISLVSPSSNQSAGGGAFDSSNLVSGDDTSGTYKFDITIPKFSETGDWTLTDVSLEDNVGNFDDVTGAQLFNIAGTQKVTVSGPIDLHPPVLVGVTATPASVDTISSPTVTFDVHATDNQANDGSGVAGGYVQLTSPTGKTREADFSDSDRTSGTPLDGHYSVSITFPKFAETASWTVTVGLNDNVGQDSTYTSGDIAALGNGSTSTVSVTGAPDTNAPVVTNIVFAPAAVDSSTGAQPLVVDVHITDNQASSDGSGVHDGSIDLASPHGSQPDMTSSLQLVAGDASDGWWEGGFDVPKFVDGGVWPITDLTVTDSVGNTAHYDQAALTTAGLTKSVTITGVADTAAPTVVSITLPASVDVTSANQQITVGLHLQDSDGTNGPGSGSGVAGNTAGFVEVQGPNGTTESSFFPSAPASGTPADGTWNVPITIHRFTDSGTWHVLQIDLQDVYGNAVTLHAADLTGFTNSFNVTSTPDTQAPVLSSVAFSPSLGVDVTHGSANVTVTIGATDDASGFDGGSIQLVSPGGTQQAGSFISATPVSGSPTSGTFQAIVSIPQFAQAGTWTIGDLELDDAVGNFVDYPTAPFPNGVTIPTLAVTDTDADTAAPAVSDIGVTPNPVDLSGGQQQVTFNLHLTDDKSGVTNGSFTIKAPSGQESFHSFNSIASGTPTDGHWIVAVPFGVHSENGNWTISEVTAQDAAGNPLDLTSSIPNSTFTVENGQAIAPDAPTSVDGTPGNGKVDLFWNGPASNGGAQIAGYHVQYSSNGGSTWTDGPTSALTSTATDVTVGGLINGTGYAFRVSAINSAGEGNFSSISPTLTPQPVPPGPPTSVGGTADDSQVQLTWTAPSDNGGTPVTGYHVQYSSNGGSTWSDGPSTALTSPATNATVTGLTNGTAYIFQVAGINASGTGGYSSSSSPITPNSGIARPAPPTGVNGTPGDTQVALTWTAPSDIGGSPITGYHVQFSSDNGTTWTDGPASALTSTATGATVTGLTNGTSYVFQVAAINAAGEGPFSVKSAAVVPSASIDNSALSHAAATTIAFGKSLVVKTALTDTTTSTGIPTQSVDLMSRPGTKGTFKKVKTVPTDNTGAAKVTVKPTVKTQYEWVYAGTATHQGITSGIQTVSVSQVVSAKLTATKVKHGKTVKIYGTVKPNELNQKVVLQQLVKGKWKALKVTAKIVKQKLPNGKQTVGFVLTFKPTAKGSYVLRVSRAATSKNAAGVSGKLTLKAT